MPPIPYTHGLLLLLLVLQIPGLVCPTDPRHCDLAAAQSAPSADWLVLRLQLLVDMGFKMASGQLEVS
jgi:hypothetical protein